MTKTQPTVLVVEDEAGLLEIISLHLIRDGCRVVTATDGLQAWRLFEAEQPDLVVLDLRLPKVSGARVLEWIRDGSDVPVIVLTAFDFAEAEHVAHLRPNDFVKKPFEARDLLRRVRFLLGGEE
jgi:DNA-binding response OmpR family regulator